MLELLINPDKAERRPWEMFFIGFFYAGVSIFLANIIFSNDIALAKYMSIFIVMFTVIFSMPFVYYLIRYEEKKITENRGAFRLLFEHQKSIQALLLMFVGFVLAFAIFNILFPNPEFSRAQIETYCQINRPASFKDCVSHYLNT